MLTAALGFGVAGWVLENVANKEARFSKAFGGAPVLILPVYAAGGVALQAIQPVVKDLPPVGRFLTYAVLMSMVEVIACAMDRKLDGPPSWDYPGCLSLPHSILWGVGGLLVE